MTIFYVDMDGVLTDFVTAACSVHKRENPFFDDGYTPYNLQDAFGMTERDFWAPINNVDFWANLAPTSECFEIIRCLSDFEICLITNPSHRGPVLEGKERWIAHHLPQLSGNVLFGAPKYFCAGPHKIIIEDDPVQIARFQNYGGRGILINRPWNIGRHSHDTMAHFHRSLTAATCKPWPRN